MSYRRVAQLKTPEKFRDYQGQLGIEIPFDETVVSGPDAPLGRSYKLQDGFTIGNRFAIHPMEGWDGTLDGKPTEFTHRRWRHFGGSGAKLIWGGEAVAVRHDGRANPKQVMINQENLPAIRSLREDAIAVHEERYGTSDNLMFGLQLTHSGRFARPNRKDMLEPIIAYHHPILDKKFNLPPDLPVISDEEIRKLIEDFLIAAELAYQAGFQFVDIKHCHGYLGHEFLSAFNRSGPYGGTFENRTRFLREIVDGIRERVPGLRIGVRVSAFDLVPFLQDPDTGVGRPHEVPLPYNFAFGSDPDDPLQYCLDETIQFLNLLKDLDIEMVNLSCASPYYNPHLMRPATFPPSDGYQPPEDPLVGVARQLNVVAQLKEAVPGLLVVGTGYSYLQDWLPNVAQAQVRLKRVDFVGLGRMVLSYPDLPVDVLEGRTLQRKKICRTFSDCTTAPRSGMISGCFPLDDFYKSRPEAEVLARVKKGLG